MKMTLTLMTALTLTAVTARAAHHEKTFQAEALCAKCELKEMDRCHTALRVSDGDRRIIYYAKENEVARTFHPRICTAPAKVAASGAVSEADGRKHILLSRIDLIDAKISKEGA